MKCKQNHAIILLYIIMLLCFSTQHSFGQEASSHPKIVAKSQRTLPFKILRDLKYWDVRTITRIEGNSFLITGVGAEDHSGSLSASASINIGVINSADQAQLLGSYYFPGTKRGVPFQVKISILLPVGFNPDTFKGFVLTNSGDVRNSQLDDADYNLSKGLEFYNSANYTGALPYFQNAAKSGSGEALNFLGLMYLQGYGVAVNKQVAFNMFSRSAETGYNWGQFNLGYAYYSGNVIKQDYNKAVYWLQKAAQQEIQDAYYYLGMMYYEGTGVTKDLLKSEDYFLKAARMDYVPSYAMLAAITDRPEYEASSPGNMKEEAVWWYIKAAENDNEDTSSPFRLGNMYSSGKIVSKDDTEAFKWYKLAAERGHALATNIVGLCYEEGDGVPKNDQEAVKWYAKAIEYGNITFGAYNLGRMYYYGKGVPQDYARAFELFTQANGAGNSDGGAFLGDMYALGQFVEKDVQKAEMEYINAMENNSSMARYALGNLYYKESLPANEQDIHVIKLYRIAADRNFAPAREKLMRLAEQGNPGAMQFADSLKAVTVLTLQDKKISFAATDIRQALRIHTRTNTGLKPKIDIRQGSDLYKWVSSEEDTVSGMLVLTFSKKPMIAAGTYPDELEIIPEYGARIKIPVIIESDGKNVVDSGLFYIPELKEYSKKECSIQYAYDVQLRCSTISFWIKEIRDGIILFATTNKKSEYTNNPFISISGNKLLTRTDLSRTKKNDNGRALLSDLEYLNDDKWHLITLCHDGRNWRPEGESVELYIDGKSVEKQTRHHIWTAHIGKINTKDFHLKNLRLYTRVLNANEIKEIYFLEAPFIDME